MCIFKSKPKPKSKVGDQIFLGINEEIATILCNLVEIGISSNFLTK
jgi:hypothetical protein